MISWECFVQYCLPFFPSVQMIADDGIVLAQYVPEMYCGLPIHFCAVTLNSRRRLNEYCSRRSGPNLTVSDMWSLSVHLSSIERVIWIEKQTQNVVLKCSKDEREHVAAGKVLPSRTLRYSTLSTFVLPSFHASEWIGACRRVLGLENELNNSNLMKTVCRVSSPCSVCFFVWWLVAMQYCETAQCLPPHTFSPSIPVKHLTIDVENAYRT